MLKPLLTTPIIIAVCLCFFTAAAQTDSTHYDLGHIRVSKDFTQGITIKGSDLEKYPTSNLADAINVWLYGTYTSTYNLTYVIDGNLVHDVNAYNIHDIEEITLIQGGLVQLNGATGTQQLVLIKTRRNKPGKQGIEADGQTSLVTLRQVGDNTDNSKSQTLLYHDYYLSAYKNYSKIQFGVSADYLRDVSPLAQGDVIKFKDPYHFDRFRFNGYANAQLWKGTSLNFNASYAPQQKNADITETEVIEGTPSIVNNQTYHSIEHLVNFDLSLKSHIVGGLYNVLSAGYDHYRYQENDVFNLIEGTIPPTTDNTMVFDYLTGSNLQLKDNLYYEKKVGDFVIEPSISFAFRHLRDTSDAHITSVENDGFDPPAITTQGFNSKVNAKTYLLTPSVNITYKKAFDIQGGFMYNLTPIHAELYNNAPPKLLPFVSATADIARLANPKATFSIKLHGSYSLSYPLSDGYFPLTGLSSFTTPGVDNTSTNGTGQPVDGTSGVIASNTSSAYNSFKTLTAGIEIDPFKSKLTFSYFFEKRNYVSSILEQVNDGSDNPYQTVLANVVYYLNSVRVNYKMISKNSFKWQTGLSATQIRQSIPDVPNSIVGSGAWTGGFVNRLEYKYAFAGADMLYMLKELNTAAGDGSKVNSFSLQNVYLGVHIKTKALKALDVFVSGRNILQNKASDITDNRKFYGLGFKLGL